jgi:hypothetical protein
LTSQAKPDLANIARDTLIAVCEDATAPASAKASAARTLAEMDGAIGRHAEKPSRGKDLTDMTLDELNSLANE